MFEQTMDAIDLLKHDHREVENLFSEFDKAADNSQRVQLAQRICTELLIHAMVEEELFYPAARDALAHTDSVLIDTANVEHASLKNLIEEINGTSSQDEMLAARMKVLRDYVEHHVREEELRLMPAVRRTVINLDSLGNDLAQRKHALGERAEFALGGKPGGSTRVQVSLLLQRTPTARKRAAPKRTQRKAAKRSAQPARVRDTKRRAGKRKSNPESPRWSTARHKR